MIRIFTSLNFKSEVRRHSSKNCFAFCYLVIRRITLWWTCFWGYIQFKEKSNANSKWRKHISSHVTHVYIHEIKVRSKYFGTQFSTAELSFYKQTLFFSRSAEDWSMFTEEVTDACLIRKQGAHFSAWDLLSLRGILDNTPQIQTSTSTSLVTWWTKRVWGDSWPHMTPHSPSSPLAQEQKKQAV